MWGAPESDATSPVQAWEDLLERLDADKGGRYHGDELLDAYALVLKGSPELVNSSKEILQPLFVMAIRRRGRLRRVRSQSLVPKMFVSFASS